MNWFLRASRDALLIASIVSCAPVAKRPAPPPSGAAPSVTIEAPLAARAASAAAKPGATAKRDVAAMRSTGTAVRPSWVPCKPGPKHEQATAQLKALDTWISNLDPTGDPGPGNRMLTRLLKHDCIAAAWAGLEADSALSLRTWWWRGGHLWMKHYLALWDVSADRDRLAMPDMPNALTLSSTRGTHGLAPILCPVGDVSCGAAAAGWVGRANRYYRLYARAFGGRAGTTVKMLCRKKPYDPARGTRYEAWVDCEGQEPLSMQVLPLGTFRVPSDGWLVVTGQRGGHGHGGNCREIRALSLSTGASYLTQRCTGPEFKHPGPVDHQVLDGELWTRAVAGRLSLPYLREAALMIFLSGHVQKAGLWKRHSRQIPKGMKATFSSGRLIGRRHRLQHYRSTLLHWSWVRQGKAVVGGELRWPGDRRLAAGDHAARLLSIAEKTGVYDCTPEPLPALPYGASAAAAKKGGTAAKTLKIDHEALIRGMRVLRGKAVACR